MLGIAVGGFVGHYIPNLITYVLRRFKVYCCEFTRVKDLTSMYICYSVVRARINLHMYVLVHSPARFHLIHLTSLLFSYILNLIPLVHLAFSLHVRHGPGVSRYLSLNLNAACSELMAVSLRNDLLEVQ